MDFVKGPDAPKANPEPPSFTPRPYSPKKPWYKNTDWMRTKLGMAAIAVFLILMGSAAAYITASDAAVPASNNSTEPKVDDSKVDEDVTEGENNQTDEETDEQQPTATPPPAAPTPPPATAPPSPPSGPETKSVVIINGLFSPSNLTIKRGDTVTWVNNDDVAHDVTSDTAGGPNSNNPMAPGESFSFTFNSADAFAYYCSIHPDMTGSITTTN